jgi:hypothetical protein
VTHSVNNDQRRIPLAFRAVGQNRFQVDIPGNRGVAPPGNYMLFAIDPSGVPSVAKVVNVRDCASGTNTASAACAAAREPDVHVWRLVADSSYAREKQHDVRSDYFYVTTSIGERPNAPAGYATDPTSFGPTFRAWSRAAPGLVPIRSCTSESGAHWLGADDCNGDHDDGTTFFAYPFPVRDSVKVHHYVSETNSAHLLLPDSTRADDELHVLRTGTYRSSEWRPMIDASDNDRLTPFWVAAP